MRCYSYKKVEELTPGIETDGIRNAVGQLLCAPVQHTGEFKHSTGLRALRNELDAVMYARGIVPEDFSMSSVRAMIAASGGATFAMVIHEPTPNSALMLTFCTFRW